MLGSTEAERTHCFSRTSFRISWGGALRTGWPSKDLPHVRIIAFVVPKLKKPAGSAGWEGPPDTVTCRMGPEHARLDGLLQEVHLSLVLLVLSSS